jgi:hypothetical protein
MKKMITVIIGLMTLCGCMSSNCFVADTASPKKGERYRLHFNTLKVVQVCEDEVHVMHHSGKGLRICVVPIENDYVTDSYLRPGLYEYVGPYTYKTIKDLQGNEMTNTVRLFKAVQ